MLEPADTGGPGLDDPRELIRLKVSDEFAAVRSEVAQGRGQAILKSLDERGTAQELIEVQYSGRYPLELLQNASDAIVARQLVDRQGRGAVRFHLTDSALIVADTGAGFDVHNVDGICSLGRSPKDPRTSIGYKGIGFKSVGEITDGAQIIAGDLAFMFDAERVHREIEAIAGAVHLRQRFPAYAFPWELREGDLGADAELVAALSAEFTTVIRLPLRADLDRELVAARVRDTISPRLMLLLDGIDELAVAGTGADFAAERAPEARDGFEEVLLEVDGADVEHWFVFSAERDVPHRGTLAALGDKWAEVGAVRISVAVPVAGVDVPADGFPLHVFFPTSEQTGLPLIVHGDFAIDMDRRHASEQPAAVSHNRWLVGEVARHIAEAVAPRLATASPARTTSPVTVAPVGAAAGFGLELREAYRAAMRSSVFVSCVDGIVRAPADALLLPRTVPDDERAYAVLDMAALERLVAPEVHTAKQVRAFLADELETPQLDAGAALGCIREPSGDAELMRLYAWLVDWHERYGRRLAALLKNVCCVRTMTGAWVTPGSDVFFPPQRDAPILPAELPVSIAHIPAEVGGLRALLESADVQPWAWRGLILRNVLPLLIATGTETGLRAAADAALRLYFDTEGGADREIARVVGAVLVDAIGAAGSALVLRRADMTYFSAAWLGHGHLEKIFGAFGEREFLAEAPPIDEDTERAGRFAYLTWLGVAQRPRVNASGAPGPGLFAHPHRHHRLWNEWFSSPEVEPRLACGQGHKPGRQFWRRSSHLDRADAVIASRDHARIAALWAEVMEHWPAYEPEMVAEIQCTHGWHHGESTRHVPSLLAYELTQQASVPAVRGRDRVLARPAECWRLARGVPRTVEPFLAVVNDELSAHHHALAVWEEMGVVDAARPSVRDLAGLLSRLEAELPAMVARDGDAGADTLFKAARWVINELNGVLASGARADGALQGVRLLARHGAERRFVKRPWYSQDPLVADAWSDELEILDADERMLSVKRAFDLPDLDRAVKLTPRADGYLPDQSEALHGRIAEASPYLAAVVTRAAPSAAETVHARLPRIRVVACRELTLDSTLGDVSRPYADVTAYIETTTEGTGRGAPLIGTVYLQLDEDNEPEWFALGPRLAEFLEVPVQGDAFSLVLNSDTRSRRRFADARGISPDQLEEERAALAAPPEADPGIPPPLPPAPAPSAPAPPGADGQPGADTPAADDESAPAPTEEPDRPPPPPVDHAAVTSVDVDTALAPSRPGGGSAPARRGALELRGRIDWESRTRQSRDRGRRGEEAVVARERDRVARMGYDPEKVVWMSDRDELSPFDVLSLDDDGAPVFIEVKATASEDPSDPFEISVAELGVGMREQDRYLIYRVTDVDSAAPTIYRYRDPVGRVLRDEARLATQTAVMRLPPPE